MAKNLDPGYIVHAMLVIGPVTSEQRAGVLRRTVDALGTLKGEGFVGEDPVSMAFLAGGEPGVDMAVMLRHPYLDPRSDAHNGWIKITVADDGAKRPAYVLVNINVGRGGDQIDLQWSVGVEILPRLALALRPSAAFMNGQLIDDEHFEALPSYAEFRRPGIPASITPWTYISGKRLDESGATEKVSHLPVAKSSPLDDGLALLVVEDIRAAPPPGFFEALERLEMRYIPPQVISGEEDGD